MFASIISLVETIMDTLDSTKTLPMSASPRSPITVGDQAVGLPMLTNLDSDPGIMHHSPPIGELVASITTASHPRERPTRRQKNQKHSSNFPGQPMLT